jgi:hypothetical protein
VLPEELVVTIMPAAREAQQKGHRVLPLDTFFSLWQSVVGMSVRENEFCLTRATSVKG